MQPIIEVKHLRLLRALAECGSLSGAARVLGYTQPAISQQVAALERRLGTPLVLRSRGGATLTEAGRVLLGHANAVLDTLARAETEVAAVAGLRAGRVRIAAFPSAAATLVVAAMTEMTDEYPGVTFTLTEAEPPEAIDLLERGECDIAVVFHYSTDVELDSRPGLVSQPLLEEAIQVALPSAHPGTTANSVALSDLWDSRWIAGCPNCRGHLLKACEEAGFSPDIAFETDDYVTLQNLARRGLGAALLPDLVRVAARVEGLSTRPLNPTQVRSVSAMSTTALTRVAGVRQTLNSLVRVGREVAAEF